MILVDSTIWSLALSRDPASLSLDEQLIVNAWSALVNAKQAAIIGLVRQQVLSNAADEARFNLLRRCLSAMRYLKTSMAAHDLAAQLFNRCKAAGCWVTATDILLCASARFHGVALFTVDEELEHVASLAEVELWRGISVH